MRGRHGGKVFINFTGEAPFCGERLPFFRIHIRDGNDFRAAFQKSPDMILRHPAGADQSDFYFLFHSRSPLHSVVSAIYYTARNK